ncbi:MAG: KEOPS complex kinase/ATPase Bud32 [Candidatus Woesearchaeota archaeon]
MIIGQGAEAILRKQENKVIKERIAKDYRVPEIDEKLRTTRTRREANILKKLEELKFPAPRLQKIDDKNMNIIMDFVEGPMLKEILHTKPSKFSKEIGRKIGILHANNIIHSDLTTSNMIHCNGEVHFIDFGLSFVSRKAEDKAVDLHLLDQALQSKHHDIYDECISAVLEGYKEGNPNWQEVLKRLETVESRGRNKKK